MAKCPYKNCNPAKLCSRCKVYSLRTRLRTRLKAVEEEKGAIEDEAARILVRAETAEAALVKEKKRADEAHMTYDMEYNALVACARVA